MDHPGIAQLRLNMRLKRQPFLLHDMTVRPVRDSLNLLLVTLGDETGTIGGAYYDVPDYVIASLKNAKAVEVTGKVSEHRGRLQIQIERIEPTELPNLQQFLPAAKRPLQEMKDELDALLADVEEPHLQALLERFFRDPEMYRLFTEAPAAKRYHHACYAGLLEHTLSVARIVLAASDLYPEMDRDLAITVALLHDIGKVRSYDPVTFDLTDEGILLSHLAIGANMVAQAIAEDPDFPEPLRLRVIHAVLAHHGELEKGSPVLPMTLEAIVLHYADSLDGDARGAIDHMERTDTGAGTFTQRSSMHDTELYLG